MFDEELIYGRQDKKSPDSEIAWKNLRLFEVKMQNASLQLSTLCTHSGKFFYSLMFAVTWRGPVLDLSLPSCSIDWWQMDKFYTRNNSG